MIKFGIVYGNVYYPIFQAQASLTNTDLENVPVMAELQAARLLPMNGGRPDTDPLPYIYTHILYLVVGSSSNVLSSTRTCTCNQLGLSLVIVISLAPILSIPYVPTIFLWSPACP